MYDTKNARVALAAIDTFKSGDIISWDWIGAKTGVYLPKPTDRGMTVGEARSKRWKFWNDAQVPLTKFLQLIGAEVTTVKSKGLRIVYT